MSDAARWKRLGELLDALLDLDASARAARLAALAGDDAQLRPELERLLAADETTRTGILDRGFESIAADVLREDGSSSGLSGKRIGPWRIVRELGRGGMGEVYLAERTGGDFEQRVALKVVRGGNRSPEILERFRRERRILARLRHPNIAALQDGGATAEGDPWFAMEYVDGERITDWCDARNLGIEERIERFEAVCRAVQYAHRNLVVHRDIKPNNVYVTADGTPKLLDFGVGKLLDPDAPDETQPTRGFLTPSFAAPEQIRGEATSTSSDVFSLGMLLYVLLAGRHPHGESSRSMELARRIAEDDAPDPSTAATRDSSTATARDIARRRGLSPPELGRRLKGDLDTIVGKALRRDPDERYASAEDLADDLARYRRSLPVLARPATARYRLRKFVRRHRVGSVAAVVALLAMVAGVAGVAWQASVAARQRDRARAVTDYLMEVFSSADPEYETGETLTAAALVERGADRIAGRFADDPQIRAEITLVLGSVLDNLAEYDRAREVLDTALEEHRGLGDDAGTQATLTELGRNAQGRGDPEEAIARYREGLELARRTFGPDDPRSIEALGATGGALLESGRAEEGGALQREALERAVHVFGEGTAGVAPYHFGVATYLSRLDDLQGAVDELQAAVDAYRAAGVGGIQLSRCYTTLGSLLDQLDRSAEGERMLREAVAVLREEYGDTPHPALADALGNLGGPLMRSSLAEAAADDRLAEAEECMREAVDILETALGPDHWTLGYAYSNLSVVKTKQGDVEAAGEYLAKAVRITRTALGDHHPALAPPLSNLGRNLLRRKKYDEAEPVYAEAIALARECFGEKHLNVTHPLLGWADLCAETGRLDEAVRAAREGWEIRRDVLGPTHSLVVETRVQLAQILAQAGKHDDANAHFGGAIADARRGLPETRAVLASALVKWAREGAATGETGETLAPLLDEALAIRTEEYGADDERTAEVRALRTEAVAAAAR